MWRPREAKETSRPRTADTLAADEHLLCRAGVLRGDRGHPCLLGSLKDLVQLLTSIHYMTKSLVCPLNWKEKSRKLIEKKKEEKEGRKEKGEEEEEGRRETNLRRTVPPGK